MSKLTEDQKDEIYSAGELDMYIKEKIAESARFFIQENMNDEQWTIEEIDTAINIYRNGFMGKKRDEE